MGPLNYFLLAQECVKVVGPALAHYWHTNPPFTYGFHNLPTMAQLSVLLGFTLILQVFQMNLITLKLLILPKDTTFLLSIEL